MIDAWREGTSDDDNDCSYEDDNHWSYAEIGTGI